MHNRRFPLKYGSGRWNPCSASEGRRSYGALFSVRCVVRGLNLSRRHLWRQGRRSSSWKRGPTSNSASAHANAVANRTGFLFCHNHSSIKSGCRSLYARCSFPKNRSRRNLCLRIRSDARGVPVLGGWHRRDRRRGFTSRREPPIEDYGEASSGGRRACRARCRSFFTSAPVIGH